MNFSLRNIVIGLVVIVLAVAIPVTLRLAQQQQKLKSKAATASCQQAAESQGYPLGICTPETDRAKLTNCPSGPYYSPDENPTRNINCDQYCYFCGQQQPPSGGDGNPPPAGSARCEAIWNTANKHVSAIIYNSDGSCDLGPNTYDNVTFTVDGIQTNSNSLSKTVANSQTDPHRSNCRFVTPEGFVRGEYDYTLGQCGSGSHGMVLKFGNLTCSPTQSTTLPACTGGPDPRTRLPGPGTGGSPPGGGLTFAGASSKTITKGETAVLNYSAWSNGSPLQQVEIYGRCNTCSDNNFKLINSRNVQGQTPPIEGTANWSPAETGTYDGVINVTASDGSQCSGNWIEGDSYANCYPDSSHKDFVRLTVNAPSDGPDPDPNKRCCADANRRIFSGGSPTNLQCHGELLTGSQDNCVTCAGTVTPNCYRCDRRDPQQFCFIPSAPPQPPQNTCPTERTKFSCRADGKDGFFWCYGGTQARPGEVAGCNDPNRSGCWTEQTGGTKNQCNISGSGSPDGGGNLACSRFELTGLSSAGTNPQGGPIYNVLFSGSNNQFNLAFTPDTATVAIGATPQTAGAPALNIAETDIGASKVRTASIPPNTSLTRDNIYMIRANVSNGTSQVSCLPIQVVVQKAAQGSECPASITSTEVKFKNADNSGVWVTQKTISQNEGVLVAGFHSGVTTTLPADISLSFSGPQGFSGTHQTNSIFTPPAVLPPGSYIFTATTNGKTGNNCTGSSTLTVQPAVSPPPSQPPQEFTQCVIVSEDKSAVDAARNCSSPLAKSYDSEPLTISQFRFTNLTPGLKTIHFKFVSTSGRVSRTISRVINYKPDPRITNAICTQSSSGAGTDITLTVPFLPDQGNGSVRLGSVDATIDKWDTSTGIITAHVDQRFTGKNDVFVTLNNGLVAKSNCTINTTTASFKAAFLCKQAGNFGTDNVDVKVFEAVPANSQNPNPEPILSQRIRLNGQGEPQGFAPVFEKNKKYELIIKAPGSLAKRVDFETKQGGTVNLNDGSPIFLPQGDIAPASAPDGKVNAFDKSELMRQWSLVNDVSRTGDLNGDSRVNSIDYACMRPHINQSDDTFSPSAPVTNPSPQPNPSASPGASGAPFTSPTPQLTLFQAASDPSFAPNTIYSQGTYNPAIRQYVQKFDDPSIPSGRYNLYFRYKLPNGQWTVAVPATLQIN